MTTALKAELTDMVSHSVNRSRVQVNTQDEKGEVETLTDSKIT